MPNPSITRSSKASALSGPIDLDAEVGRRPGRRPGPPPAFRPATAWHEPALLQPASERRRLGHRREGDRDVLLAEPDVEREGLIEERPRGRHLHAQPDDAVEERTVERWQRRDRQDQADDRCRRSGRVGRPWRGGAHQVVAGPLLRSSRQQAISSSDGVSKVVVGWGIVSRSAAEGRRGSCPAGRRRQLVAATVRPCDDDIDAMRRPS